MAQVLLNGIIVGGIYAILAVGFTLIYSAVRFYHLAYGGLALLGAYLTHWFQTGFDIPFFFSLFLASAISGIFGMLFWQTLYAPLQRRKASDLGLMVASFGLLIVLQNVIALVFGNATKSLSITAEIVPGYDFFGLSITYSQVVILAAVMIVSVLFEIFLQKTKSGTAIRAVGQNTELALTVGIDSNRVMRLVFFLGTFLATFGMSLIALEIGLRPTHGFYLLFKVVIASIIGGMNSIKGSFLGGLLLGISENIGIQFFGAKWQDTVAFVLLVVFLLFFPNGLFRPALRSA